MSNPSKTVQAGQVCLNPSCEHYGDVGSGNIVRYGKDRRGGQRFRCNTCRKCFCERKGTIFYRKQTQESVIISSLTSIGLGARLSSVAHAQGKKPDTIGQWVKEAGRHAANLENVLFEGYEVGASQVDGLWSYVKNKGEKK
jgi:transposase-like protein